MPEIHPLNTISNYNRMFRFMIKNQLQKKGKNQSRELPRSRTPNRSGTHSRFRPMPRSRTHSRHRTHSRSRAISRPRENNTTNHTKRVYEELKQLQIQKKAKNQAIRMAAKKGSKTSKASKPHKASKPSKASNTRKILGTQI